MSQDEDNSLVLPEMESDPHEEYRRLEATRQMMNQVQYVSNLGNSVEHSIRNSVDLKQLIELENQDLGHMTISQLLDVYQDMRATKKNNYYEDIDLRKKPVNPSPHEIREKENEIYRRLLDNLVRMFRKQRKGSAFHEYANAIEKSLQRVDAGDLDF